MQRIRDLIEEKKQEFSHHGFFGFFAGDEPLPGLLPFADALGFWPMVFQDVLRLNAQRVRDPDLKLVARHHLVEDAGHEQWYLHDLARLGVPMPGLASIFGRNRVVRDASYALIAEVFRLKHDESRLALLLALEATGHVFFERMAEYLKRTGVAEGLRYFSDHHLNVERAHDLFTTRADQVLSAISLSDEAFCESRDTVTLAFGSFRAMFDALAIVVHARVLGRSDYLSDFPLELPQGH
jgi:hypothetical protein